jgi:hypothetical protein
MVCVRRKFTAEPTTTAAKNNSSAAKKCLLPICAVRAKPIIDGYLEMDVSSTQDSAPVSLRIELYVGICKHKTHSRTTTMIAGVRFTSKNGNGDTECRILRYNSPSDYRAERYKSVCLFLLFIHFSQFRTQ